MARSVWVIWLIWFIWLSSFSQKNQTDRKDQMNKTDRPLFFSILLERTVGCFDPIFYFES